MTRQGSSTFRSVIGLLIAALCVLTSVPFLATMRLSLALPMAEQPPESFTGKW